MAKDMSKKEAQRRRREEKRRAAQRRERTRSTLIKIGVLILVPLAIYVLFRGLFGGAPVLPPDEVVAGDHVRGPEEAPVTMTIYADFQCPACAAEARLIERAWPRIREHTRLVFRHFPLDTHPHAFLAARYAEAAGLQERFWEMHDRLFANQQRWAGLGDAGVREAFNGYAMELGLDMDRLRADLDSDRVRDKIVADRQGGIRAGVRGTPATFLNGRMVSNPATVSQLEDLIDEVR